MLQLFLDGQQVALALDTKIGITALNPYFNEMEAASYTFTIPYKPNEHILKYAGRIQNATRTFSCSAILIVDAVQILRGEAIADGDLQDGQFPIILRSAKTSFVKLAEANKLQEMDFGGDDPILYTNFVDLNDYRSLTLYGHYPDYPFICAPFYAPKAWNDVEGTDYIPNFINKFDMQTQKLDNSYSISVVSGHPITYNFYVRWILKKIIELFGFILDSDDMETIPDLNRWFLLSLNVDDAVREYKTAFPLITAREFLQILRQFGIVLILNEKDGHASIKLIKDLFTGAAISNLFNNRSLSDILVFDTPTDGYIISYKNFENDLLVNEYSPYLIEVTSLPTASAFTSGNTYHLVPSDRIYVALLQTKVLVTDPDVYKWTNIGMYLPYKSGNVEASIELNTRIIGQRQEAFSFTQSRTGGGGVPVTKIWAPEIELPETSQKMNFMTWHYGKAKYEDFDLSFLFNWGLQRYDSNDSSFFTYHPVISGDCYTIEDIELGSISMRTHGTKSIITQLVKDEQDWILRRKSKRQYFNLSVGDYAQFRWNEIQNIGSVNYFVNSLKFDISRNGISLVEAELFTV